MNLPAGKNKNRPGAPTPEAAMRAEVLAERLPFLSCQAPNS